MTILTSEYRKNITRTKKSHFIMNEMTVQEDITVLNVYAPNNSFKIHKIKTDRTKRINKLTIIPRDFTFLSQQLQENDR